MSRATTILIVVLFVYAGSYLLFRQLNIEVWDRDKQAHVIFPTGNLGSALYYAWRPLSYLDSAITGMRFHIGPHR